MKTETKTTANNAIESSNLVGHPPALDVCCGPRSMWFDKEDPRAVFVDRREEEHEKPRKCRAQRSRALWAQNRGETENALGRIYQAQQRYGWKVSTYKGIKKLKWN